MSISHGTPDRDKVESLHGLGYVSPLSWYKFLVPVTRSENKLTSWLSEKILNYCHVIFLSVYVKVIFLINWLEIFLMLFVIWKWSQIVLTFFDN